ncbi:MAG: TIGR01777 family oxidoreductase [Legionellaceae bacterium]|nr:TIGR01777 family oxidoreductase [Legionellaceae bacterium]
MNILIAGASGFIGHALVLSLKTDHQITVLGRNKVTLKQEFSNTAICYTWDDLPQLDATKFDAIINLCGFNIAASRWSEAVKKQLIDSRVKTNTILINWIIEQHTKPHFICANAVGIYGLQDNNDQSSFDEDTPINTKNPPDFLSEIGIRWQEALKPAIDYGIPVTTTRFGVVLQKNQGMLKKLFPSFYVGLGAIIGDGHQTVSWVHINDVVGAIRFILNKPELTGAVNVTSPYPVNQQEFAQKLALCLHRTLFLKIPPFFIRLLFGEMGECLLLKGQRVLPKRLLASGYQFQYPQLTEALQQEFRG